MDSDTAAGGGSKRLAQRSNSSEKGKGKEINGSRRSSSISADHANALQKKHKDVALPANSLIKEEHDEDDSSEQSDNGLSKLTSNDAPESFSRRFAARQSEEVKQETSLKLKNEILATEDPSRRNKLSMQYQHSNDSSSTPPLTSNQILNQAKRNSS